MEPMPLPESSARRLLDVARHSIAYGLQHHEAWTPDPLAEPDDLRHPRATFVTLHLHGRLRGCIGTLEAHQSLVEDVAANAYAAAFEDPRFPSVTMDEVDALQVHISVLTPPVPFPCRDEADLLACLQPGRDGLILRDGSHRATFLPAVWADLPDPKQFLAHLKRKAGLPANYWSDTLRFWRYAAESIG
jgi:AmmeMemoRadiSam system protein A